jgi:hypothetical protein
MMTSCCKHSADDALKATKAPLSTHVNTPAASGFETKLISIQGPTYIFTLLLLPLLLLLCQV